MNWLHGGQMWGCFLKKDFKGLLFDREIKRLENLFITLFNDLLGSC